MPSKLLPAIVCMGLLHGTFPALAQEVQSPANSQQTAADTREPVFIPLQNGEVDARQLFQSVADELHWVAGSVAGFTRAFGVDASDNRLTSQQLETLVERFPAIFSRQEMPGSKKPGLAVDTDALATMLADKKSNLRRWLASVDGEPLAELAKVASTWDSSSTAPRRIVVVAAGLHSPVKSATEMAIALHKRTDLPMCTYKYPNDGPIAESAQWLSQELLELHMQYPTSKLSLVTHSLGGLVARGAIELPGSGDTDFRSSLANRTGLDQLIQVFPPNHGSSLSDYGPLLEGFEQLYNLTQRRADGKRQRVLVKMIVDGFNEASADLNPTSEFLSELNKCSRDPQVRYSILAGNKAPLRPGMTGLLANVWDRIASTVNEPAGLNARVRDVLDCAELQDGKGDGVVSLESAKLDGVADFELLEMNHLTWTEPDSDNGKLLVEAIARRLENSL